MSTSKPLRGTSRLTPSTSGRSGSRPNARRAARALGGVERTEAVDVDARAGRRRRAAARPAARDRLARRVLARGDDAGGAAQHPPAELPAAGEPTRAP